MRARPRLLNLIASVLTAAVEVLYVILIRGQGSRALTDGRILLVGTSLATAAVLSSLTAASDHRRLNVVLLSVTTFLLLAWTLLGMFSIGILVAVPMVLTTACLVRELEEASVGLAMTAMATGIATLVAVGFGISAT